MELHEEYEDTPFKWYRPDEVDEYLVIVNLPEDWEEVHNYIINEKISKPFFLVTFNDWFNWFCAGYCIGSCF